MKSYVGKPIYVEGRGEILLTKIPKQDELPVVGETILANGIERKIREIDIVSYGDFGGRGESVGLVLHNK